MTATQPVRYAVDKRGVVRLTLNRPESSNALDLELASALREAVDRARNQPGLRAVLLTGVGPRFCVGGDVHEFVRSGNDVVSYISAVATQLHAAIAGLADMPAPVVAAVHGSAAGAGLSLVLACDVAIAARSATFVFAYPAVGLTPDGGASWQLPRQLGLRRAVALAMTNPRLSANEAELLGIVTRICDDDTLAQATDRLLDDLADGCTAALVATRQLMASAHNRTLLAQLDLEARALASSASTTMARERLSAFVRRRPTRPSPQ